jgi:hypothetical protein
MTLTFRQQLYTTLRNFDRGVEDAAKEANGISTQQVRVVMMEKASITEKQHYIVKACQSVIDRRTNALKSDLKATSKHMLALSEKL